MGFVCRVGNQLTELHTGVQARDAASAVISVTRFCGVCPAHQNGVRLGNAALGEGLTGARHASNCGVLGCLLLGRMGLLLVGGVT